MVKQTNSLRTAPGPTARRRRWPIAIRAAPPPSRPSGQPKCSLPLCRFPQDNPSPAQEAKNSKKIRNTNLGPIRILVLFHHVFIKIGIMGWIWIDFALLNTCANCDLYLSLFLYILTFFEICTRYQCYYLLHIAY